MTPVPTANLEESAAPPAATGGGGATAPARSVMTAPLLPAVIALAAGIAIDRFLGPWGTATWALLAGSSALAGLLAGRRGWASIPTILVGVLAIGGARHHRQWSDLAPDDLARVTDETPRPAWLRGVARTVPEHRDAPEPEGRPDDDGYTRFELEITAASDGLDWHPAAGRALVTVGGRPDDFEAGDPIEAAGALSLIAGPLNPGERDPRLYPRSRGIRLRLAIDDASGLRRDPDGGSAPIARLLGRVRAAADVRLDAVIPDDAEPIADALLLGRREGLDDETADAFARTGAAHVLAISGLHLSAVAGALWFGCRVVGRGPKTASRLVIVAAIGYATLVGWTPSVARASVMACAVAFAVLVDRRPRPANVLALAAIATLAVDPASLAAAGWQLSFLAVAVLALGVPPLIRSMRHSGPDDPDSDPLDDLQRRFEPRWRRLLRRIGAASVAMLVASAAVWVASVPLVAWRFHIVAPIGILLNLALVPLAGLAVAAGGSALLLSMAWTPLGMPSGWCCGQLLRLLGAVVAWGESIPWGHSYVPTPPSWAVLAFYGGLALAALASAARWSRVARRSAWLGTAAIGTIGAVLTLIPDRPTTPEVEILAVGHGLSTILQGSDGTASLYDCGRLRDPSVGARIVAPSLWARGVRRLESIILSHADSDHCNGLPDVLERFEVGALVVPDGFGDSGDPGALRVLEAARARGITVRRAAAGDRFKPVDGIDAHVLHPRRGWLPEAPDNDRSLVLELEAGGGRVLLTGDLDGAGLVELIAAPHRPFDAVVAPHHGGRSANPPWFHDWAGAPIVVASQRRPAPGASDALAGLDDRGVDDLRTWRVGAVTFGITEHGAAVRTFLPEARPAPIPPDHAPPPADAGGVHAGFGPGPVAVPILAGVVGFALGLLLFAALAIREWGAWALVLPGSGSNRSRPMPPPWHSIGVVAADGVALRGWRRDADDPGENPPRIALVLHGLAEDGTALRDRAEALRRAGWTVVVPDARSFGRSGGDRASFGTREAVDVRSWLDALAPDRPGSAFVLWGRSMGAAIALRAAVDDDRVLAVVLEAPYADLRRAMAARLRRLPVPGAPLLSKAVLDRAAGIAGASLDRPRPIDLAPRIAIPTLILHGTDDRVAPTSEVRRLADAFPEGRSPELLAVPGAGHADVFERGGPELANRIVAFLDRAVGRDFHQKIGI